jgi:uncharacterized tellurite resistance protein B-like protein
MLELKTLSLDTHDQKISHLNALYHIACADNDLSELEIVYIRKVAERLGVTLTDVPDLKKTEPDLDLPNREYKIYALFHRLALILTIDGKAEEKERQYCFNLGIKMGLHPNAIQEIIDYAILHGALNTTPKEVMTIFRKYLN